MMLANEMITLRPIELEDGPLLQKLINDPYISANVVGWGMGVSLFSQEQWIRSANESASHRLVICDNQTHEAIGITGLWNIDWHNRSAMSGIKLLTGTHKKGLGTQALRLCMAWAFYCVGLRRLHATILDFNQASLHLYVKKCGFRVEGLQKQAIFRKGEWHDLYNVAILKQEFDALADAKPFIEMVCPIDTTAKVDLAANTPV